MTASLNISHGHLAKTRKNIYKSALNSLYEKKKIWEALNQDRLQYQKDKELEKERLKNKKIYAIYGKKYFKLVGENVDYYVLEDSLKNIPSSQYAIQLYGYSFSGMKIKERALIKMDKTTNNILISEDRVRVYFKSYKIESLKRVNT